MDGSNTAFLLDAKLFSPNGPRPANGILYVEDFDAAPRIEIQDVSPPPLYGEQALAEARAAGREEGLQAALADGRLLHMQVQSACLQSVADGLAAARASLERVAEAQAGELAGTLLAILQAAVPATMRAHARMEVGAVIAALLPGMMCEPELRVRAHPAMADTVRETLAGKLPAEGCVLSVCADPALAEGDVSIAWLDGHARRHCADIWAGIVAALAPLRLPHFEDIACDKRR